MAGFFMEALEALLGRYGSKSLFCSFMASSSRAEAHRESLPLFHPSADLFIRHFMERSDQQMNRGLDRRQSRRSALLDLEILVDLRGSAIDINLRRFLRILDLAPSRSAS